MSLLAHLLREYHEQYNDDPDQEQQSDDFQDAEREEVEDQAPAPVEDTRKVHKIKQTFSVDQGDTKLDTTVMIRVVASNEQDAHRIADQQLSKLAAYMKDIDLNDREDRSEERDFSGIRERANKLWQNRR